MCAFILWAWCLVLAHAVIPVCCTHLGAVPCTLCPARWLNPPFVEDGLSVRYFLQAGKWKIVTDCNQCKLCSSHHASASTLQAPPALPLLYFTPQCTLGGVGCTPIRCVEAVGGAQLRPPAWAIPAPHSTAAHHSDHFRAVPRDCGVFLLVPADSARGRVWVQPTGSVLCKLRA